MEEKILYKGSLGVDYTQFYIDNHNDDDLLPEEAFEKQENGLCGASQKGKLFFVPGLHDGYIDITVTLFNQEPEIDDSFDEIVEVSLEISEPTMLCEWAHEETHDLDLPNGVYRVRYSLTCMDDEHNEDTNYELPLLSQKHAIQIWPCPLAQDKTLKTISSTASYWHSEWGKA